MLNIKSLTTVGLGLAALLAPTTLMLAAVPPQRVNSNTGLKISLEFPPTSNRGAPSSTVGGGQRGGCVDEKNIPLQALMPPDQVWSSVAANPTFFVYVPENTAKVAELVISDAEGKVVHKQELSNPNQLKGIVKIPTNVTLQAGQEYDWDFTLICDPKIPDRSGDKFVAGKVQLKTLDNNMKAKIDQTQDLLKKAELYAKSGIWNETILLAAQFKDVKPQEWEKLLISVKLKTEIASQPLVTASNK